MAEDFYAVKVEFAELGQLYTYKVHNSVRLEKDDLVITENNGKYSFARVKRIGGFEFIDPNATFDYKYIVQKLDLTMYEALNTRSDNIRTTLTRLKQAEVKKDVFSHLTDGLDEDAKTQLTQTLALPGEENV